MLIILITVLFIHWVGDFVAQSRWMAENKSKDNKALLIHIGIYTAVLFLGLSLFKGYLGHLPASGIAYFIIINAVIHLCIDYCTSRLNAYLWTNQKITPFWWSIGFDQFLHNVTLLTSAWYLLT